MRGWRGAGVADCAAATAREEMTQSLGVVITNATDQSNAQLAHISATQTELEAQAKVTDGLCPMRDAGRRCRTPRCGSRSSAGSGWG